jgi:uncharacterized membrane protein
MTQHSLYPRMVAALLALLGLLDAAYLALERLTGGALACPIGGGCATVQDSAYATLLGIPVAFIGVAGYAALLGVALRSLHAERLAGVPIALLLLGLASAGVLFSAYLVYLQVAVIGAICFWCMVSALLELGIWAAALYDWRQRRAGPAPTPARPACGARAPR